MSVCGYDCFEVVKGIGGFMLEALLDQETVTHRELSVEGHYSRKQKRIQEDDIYESLYA